MKKLNITFCSFPDFSGNGRALYDYMEKTYGHLFNYVWIMHDEKNINKVDGRLAKAILIGTDEFKQYIVKTNIFFTTHADLIGDKKSAKKSLYIELWHGAGPKDSGFMVENLSKDNMNWYEFLSNNIDYLCAPSDFFKTIFSCMFGLKCDRIKTLGYPKLDFYFKPNGKDKLSKIIGEDVSKFKKIIFYMPTFRKGRGHSSNLDFGENIIYLKKYDEKKLIGYLEKNNYLLCIKKHPSEESNFLDNFDDDLRNIKVIKQSVLDKSGYDINELLSCGDTLITDYSSLGLEFLFLNKPVIYLNTDLDNYSNSRGLIFSDYDFWSSADSLNTIDQLILKLNEYLNDRYILEQKFIAKKKLFFGDLIDGGCKNICNFIFDKDGNINKKLSRNTGKDKDLIKKIDELEKSLDDKNKELIKEQNENECIKNKLSNIEKSRGWKFVQKVRKIRGKIKWKN